MLTRHEGLSNLVLGWFTDKLTMDLSLVVFNRGRKREFKSHPPSLLQRSSLKGPTPINVARARGFNISQIRVVPLTSSSATYVPNSPWPIPSRGHGQIPASSGAIRVPASPQGTSKRSLSQPDSSAPTYRWEFVAPCILPNAERFASSNFSPPSKLYATSTCLAISTPPNSPRPLFSISLSSLLLFASTTL